MRQLLEYAIVGAVSGMMRLLPMTVVRTCGDLLGAAAFRLDRYHRHVALDNLAYAFPTKPLEERRALVRGTFGHFGGLLLELLKFGTLSDEAILEHVEVEGADRVWHAHEKGRGVLLFTGHFGYWEIHAIAHALQLRPISVVARPLDNPKLHAMLERIRTRTGNSVIYRQGAIRKVLRALAENRAVAILIDQHLHTSDAVYVDYFRRPAATTSALAALALRTGAPVIPAFALPLPHGRYRLIYEHPVEPPQADSPDAIRDFTQRCTDVLEMYVRRHPDLWLWMHRRWRDADQALAAIGVEAKTDA